LSKKLASIVKNVPIKFDLEKCKFEGYDRQKIVSLFQELEFKSLLGKLFGLKEKIAAPALVEKESIEKSSGKKLLAFNSQEVKYTLINTPEKFEAFWQEIKNQKEFTLDTETTSLNPFAAELLGASFCFREAKAYFVIYRRPWFEKLKSLLQDKNIKKNGHNIKYDLEVLTEHGFNLENIDFDTMIASYLLNPGTRAHSLDNLAFTEFGYQMQPIEKLIGPKAKNQLSMKEVAQDKLAWYSCEDADYTFRLKEKL